jgi:hypothetical protein
MIDRIKNEPALVYGAVQAIIGLVLAFGIDLSNEQTGAIMVATAAILAFVVRAAVVPVRKVNPATPVERDEIGAVDLVLGLLIAILVLALLIFLVSFNIIEPGK